MDARLPVSPQILAKLLQALPQTTSSVYDVRLFGAMFTLCFHAFLRIGEVTYSAAGPVHTLLLSSLSPVTPKGFTVTLHSYKHSQGRAHHIHVAPSVGSVPCAVTHMHQYLMLRGSNQGCLFLAASGSPVSGAQFNQALKAALVFCDLPSDIKSHSFRIGAATYAAEIGLSDSKIRSLGRWHSNAFLRYIR